MSWELTGERPWQRAEWDFSGVTEPRKMIEPGSTSREELLRRCQEMMFKPTMPVKGTPEYEADRAEHESNRGE